MTDRLVIEMDQSLADHIIPRREEFICKRQLE